LKVHARYSLLDELTPVIFVATGETQGLNECRAITHLAQLF